MPSQKAQLRTVILRENLQCQIKCNIINLGGNAERDTPNTVIYVHNHTCKENLVLLDRLLIYQGQFFRYILIQTFSFFLCLYIYLTMDLRWKTKHQTARKRFIRDRKSTRLNSSH